MKATIGTFNLNNLFSRYNFKGEIEAIKDEDTAVEAEYLYQFGSTDRVKIRKYRGKFVKKKDADETRKVADRIKEKDLNILAVQEVEDIDTLREFNRDQLNGRYPFLALVEGNAPRLIDIGILSDLPIGAVTSWQNAVHANDSTTPIFGRDLLEVQILNASRSQVLFFKFKSSEASLKHYSGKVTINTHVLTNVRDLIKDKIAAHAIDYIMALPDLS